MRSILAVLLALCAFWLSPVLAKKKHNNVMHNIVIFGDSYSDNGNLFRLSENTYPGKRYFKGRFSNGITWAEAVKKMVNANRYINFDNYAHGQAKLSGKACFYTHKKNKVWQLCAPDLNEQINTYLKESTKKHREHTIAIIFIGANDLFDEQKKILSNPTQYADNKVKQLQKNVNRLFANNTAKVIVFGLRAIQHTPFAKEAINQADKEYPNAKIQLLSTISRWNHKLHSWSDTTPNLYFYSPYRFDITLLRHGKPWRKWGNKSSLILKNDDQCYTNHGNYIDIVGRQCENADEYFYYDRAHPVASVHWLMANDLYTQVLSELLK